ncbi:MAG: helix-turn-helix domain-containing protein [Nanoarchaeota archaeon]
MIVQTDFLKKIKDFGLNTYEAKLWTALLSRGVSTAGELSDIANVPRSRSYDVLESLEKKGFIIMKIAKPIKYMAVPPAEVLERVKKRVQNDAEEQEKSLEELRTSKILTELNLLHSQGIEATDPQDITGSIKGRNNIYNHLDYLIKEAKKSVVIYTTEEGLLRKYDSLKKTLRKAKERGIKISIVAPISKKSDGILSDLQKIADVKNADVKGRVCIIDNLHTVFMLTDDQNVHPSFDIGVWVQAPYVGNLFTNALSKITKV